MSAQTYWLFLPACFAINMALGPNNMLSISNGAHHGVRYAVAAASGRLLAFTVMIAIAGFGLGALLLASQTLFSILKFGGAAYLIWIGIKLFRAGPAMFAREEGPSAGRSAQSRQAVPLMKLIKQECFVAAGNPKAILVFTAFFPQFVDRHAYASSFTLLGVTFLLLETIAIALYSMLGSRVGAMASGARGFRWFNRISGSVMIFFGLLLAFVRKPAG